jgi:leader peptidase (prepilin peptidase) / N-methyltransferase
MPLLLFAGGASLASFLHALAWRIPRGRNVLTDRSTCESCDTVLRPWHLIPIVSWLALRARCPHCQSPIPARHLIVELTGGLLALTALLWFP